ncbi:hypothetical protein ACIBCM_20915 [Streptomyces sp. NPDC051018]|uniref:hypothetical protein n=1 Tax=Streptomyces sp. NPDC051018 TaxID=3365639 RepID=UPI0037A50A31
MTLYVGLFAGAAALLAALAGGAAVGWGWLPPWQRRHVVHPRLFGWAMLALAVAIGIQLGGGLLVDNGLLRFGTAIAGGAVMLSAAFLMLRAQRSPRSR